MEQNFKRSVILTTEKKPFIYIQPSTNKFKSKLFKPSCDTDGPTVEYAKHVYCFSPQSEKLFQEIVSTTFCNNYSQAAAT